MDRHRKTLLKREYKEHTPRKGVLRVYSTVTGENWVDTSTTLDTIHNRVWFDLRRGSHRNRDLQRAWDEGGADAVRFEIVEVFSADVSGHALERLAKGRKAYWMDELDASPCL